MGGIDKLRFAGESEACPSAHRWAWFGSRNL